MERVIASDDQPISATFFGEGKWLSEFITPDALEIRKLYSDLTHGIKSRETKIAACHQWVASEVKYKPIITGRLWVEGKSSVQRDLWMDPSMVKRVRVGNCLAEGSKILVVKDKHYQVKRIEELSDFDGCSVLSYNWQTGQIEPKPILRWFNNGEKEVITARMNNGEKIQATAEHLFYHNGNEISLEKAISGQADIHNIRHIPPLSAQVMKYKHSPEHLWLVGMYLAEGHTGKSHVVICNDDPELLSKIEQSLDYLKVPHRRTNLKHSNYVRVLKNKQGIRNLKKELRELGHKAQQKHLTPELLSLGRPQLKQLMQGYCDGDGYLPTRINVRRRFNSRHTGDYKYKKSFVLQYGTASELLADQLKVIHLILGRPLWYYYEETSHGAGKNPLPRHLMIEYKNPSYGRVNGFRDLGYLQIKGIVGISKMPVYDIEVADNHNFMLANGTIAHNCANKSFLLTSLLRNELSPQAVHCVLGNLHNHNEGGHAWCQVRLGERDFIIEPTRPDVEALVPAFVASRYEAVHLFNDKESFVIEGRTVLEPFTACYSTWLKDYLDYAYIEGRK